MGRKGTQLLPYTCDRKCVCVCVCVCVCAKVCACGTEYKQMSATLPNSCNSILRLVYSS